MTTKLTELLIVGAIALVGVVGFVVLGALSVAIPTPLVDVTFTAVGAVAGATMPRILNGAASGPLTPAEPAVVAPLDLPPQ